MTGCWREMEEYRWRATRFVFFFQAEDGIRDLTVTGVQTCALPILSLPRGYDTSKYLQELVLLKSDENFKTWKVISREPVVANGGSFAQARTKDGTRSEERRVGKEGRSRWSPDH